MANQLYIPRANPISYYEMDYQALPQYLSRHMDDYMFRHQHDNPYAAYNQKWIVQDAVWQQMEANFGPISVRVVDCDLVDVIAPQTATIIRTHKYISGFFVYENTISWATVPPGIYFVLLELPGGLVQISEPQEVLESGERTMLHRYKSSTYHGDIIWETGYNPTFRVEARMARMDPATERTGYHDQQFNPRVLRAVPYRTWEIVYGHPFGVPDWVREKLNWIYSCDEVEIDGKLYGVFEESQWDGGEIDPAFPLQFPSIKVQEGLNRASKITTIGVDPNKRLVVGVPVDSTIFGDLSAQAGSNLIPINDIE
jgi:hypothetical protein